MGQLSPSPSYTQEHTAQAVMLTKGRSVCCVGNYSQGGKSDIP